MIEILLAFFKRTIQFTISRRYKFYDYYGTHSGQQGYSSAVSNDAMTVVFGAPGDDTGGGTAGAVYIYISNDNGLNYQSQKIYAAPSKASSAFGQYLFISNDGSTILVPTPSYDNDKGYNAGSCFIYRKNEYGSYQGVQTLFDENGKENKRFGVFSGLSGDGSTIVVGVPSHIFDGTEKGSIFVYNLQKDGTFILNERVYIPDSFQLGGGISISEDGNTLVTGGNQKLSNGSNLRTLFIMTREPGGLFTESQRLTQSSYSEEIVKDLLLSLNMKLSGDGKILVVPATNNSNSYIVELMIFEKGSDDIFRYVTSIKNPSNVSVVYPSSYSVSHDGGTIITCNSTGFVGGEAYLFNRQDDGFYTQSLRILPNLAESGDRFGFSCHISKDGKAAVFGAPSDYNKNYANSGNNHLTGSATLYTFTD